MTFNYFPAEIPEDGECDIIIMGVPTDGGSGHISGQRAAPDGIRRTDAWDSLYDVRLGSDLGVLTVVDIGDCFVHNGDVELTNANITEYVAEYAGACELFLALGGDHSITPHVIRGLMKHHPVAPVVIHLDAHADIGSHEGYASAHHGSWVRYALDEGLATSVHTFGVRALGPAKEWYERAPRARQYTGSGSVFINRIMDVATEAMRNGQKVYLSVDLDVVDPAFAPGVVYPEPGGWTSTELLNAVATVCSFTNVIGVDIVEAVPALDVRDLTLRLASRCVIAAMRGYYLSRTQFIQGVAGVRRRELEPVPEGEKVLKDQQPERPESDVEDKTAESGTEYKTTGQYADPQHKAVSGSDEDERDVEGGMSTRAIKTVKPSGRGAKKAAKTAKKTAKSAKKAAKGAKKATKTAKKTVKKAAKAAKKTVAPAAKKAAKAPAKAATKVAKKVAKKR